MSQAILDAPRGSLDLFPDPRAVQDRLRVVTQEGRYLRRLLDLALAARNDLNGSSDELSRPPHRRAAHA
jgi:hypothetical protein